jgi:hypothetical protein
MEPEPELEPEPEPPGQRRSNEDHRPTDRTLPSQTRHDLESCFALPSVCVVFALCLSLALPVCVSVSQSTVCLCVCLCVRGTCSCVSGLPTWLAGARSHRSEQTPRSLNACSRTATQPAPSRVAVVAAVVVVVLAESAWMVWPE